MPDADPDSPEEPRPLFRIPSEPGRADRPAPDPDVPHWNRRRSVGADPSPLPQPDRAPQPARPTTAPASPFDQDVADEAPLDATPAPAPVPPAPPAPAAPVGPVWETDPDSDAPDEFPPPGPADPLDVADDEPTGATAEHPATINGGAAEGGVRFRPPKPVDDGIAALRARLADTPLAPLGELNGRRLDRRAIEVNEHRIGKLEPEWNRLRRTRSFIVLVVLTLVVAAVVAAVLAIAVEALSVAVNHAVSKSAGA